MEYRWTSSIRNEHMILIRMRLSRIRCLFTSLYTYNNYKLSEYMSHSRIRLSDRLRYTLLYLLKRKKKKTFPALCTIPTAPTLLSLSLSRHNGTAQLNYRKTSRSFWDLLIGKKRLHNIRYIYADTTATCYDKCTPVCSNTGAHFITHDGNVLECVLRLGWQKNNICSIFLYVYRLQLVRNGSTCHPSSCRVLKYVPF